MNTETIKFGCYCSMNYFNRYSFCKLNTVSPKDGFGVRGGNASQPALSLLRHNHFNGPLSCSVSS